jgi:hypothetical protein
MVRSRVTVIYVVVTRTPEMMTLRSCGTWHFEK